MWTVMPSPVGDLRIVERDGSIGAIEFSPFRQPVDGRPLGARSDDDPVLAEAVRQLAAYFEASSPTSTCRSRRRHRLPAPRVDPARARSATARRRLRPDRRSPRHDQRGVRAVGLANGRNPIPIVLPCHRVDRRQRHPDRLRLGHRTQADSCSSWSRTHSL